MTVLLFETLALGALFAFADDPDTCWEYRGNGWYGHPLGYDGGPWHRNDNPAVTLMSGGAR